MTGGGLVSRSWVDGSEERKDLFETVEARKIFSGEGTVRGVTGGLGVECG